MVKILANRLFFSNFARHSDDVVGLSILALDRKSLFYIVIALASLLFSPTAVAQTTKVKGSVKDADTGEGIPFANVYFKNTTIGVTTDLDGNYTMETRDHSVSVLCVMILGYEAKEVPINNGSFNQVDFKLKSTVEALNAVIVKPDDH